MTKDKGLEKILDRLYIMTPYGRIGLSKSEKQKYQHQILSYFKGMIPSEGEIMKIIKDEHIMTQGAMDTDVFVVVPYKELAKAIARAYRERV